MTEFEITINGNTERVHAKHIVNGNYLVRQLKTANFSMVKYIETLHADGGQQSYKIKSFYPSSKYYNTDKIDQKVTKIMEIAM